MKHLSSRISAAIWCCVYVWWSLIFQDSTKTKETKKRRQENKLLKNIWILNDAFQVGSIIDKCKMAESSSGSSNGQAKLNKPVPDCPLELSQIEPG